MGFDNLIDGRAIAEQIHAETSARIDQLKRRGIQAGLSFVRVGEDPASKVYVGMKEKTSRRLGIASDTKVLAADASEGQLLELIDGLNRNPNIHGILIQAPLPSHIHAPKIYSAVNPSKDVDGFHPLNVGKLMLGASSGCAPCTPAGVQELLVRSRIPTEGAEVTILGRGDIVGKPMAAILVQKDRRANSTVTICHSRSKNIAEHCRKADILIAAMGVAEFVKRDMVKPGATVIDVGVNRVTDPTADKGSRLVGDVAFTEVQPIAGRITPNPGGVGPMTIAMLMANTVRAAEMATQKPA